MLVYGGYQDLRGSSNELWGFHFGKWPTVQETVNLS
jgi:hypothetical protein